MAQAWVVDEYVDEQDGTVIARWWYPLHDTWAVVD
jgi:hypothetical protein